MKPLHASLVLLLLALCRPSSAANTDDPETKAKEFMTTLSKLYDLIPTAQKAALEKRLDYADLFVAAAVQHNGLVLKDTDAGKKALHNGLHCVFDKPTSEAEFRAAFGARDVAKEKPYADKLGVNCGTKPTAPIPKEWTCYCGVNPNPIVYCAALKMLPAGGPTGKCPKQAFDELSNEGKKELAKLYEVGNMLKENPDKDLIKSLFDSKEGSVAAFAKTADPTRLLVFCDADDAKVEAKMAPLLASAGIYAVMDELATGLILGTKMASGLAEACTKNDADLMALDFGKCYCDKASPKGFIFCLYKELAKQLKKAGALSDCDSTPKIDPGKVPSAVALGGKKEGGSSDKPTGNPTPAPASEATTSSLLMVPLAAAAVMLARV